MPHPTRSTVEARAARDYPHEVVADVLAILDRYGSQPYEIEIHRVHMAILTLSDGRRDLLESCVASAKADYRDVLAYAEYPAQMSAPVLDES